MKKIKHYSGKISEELWNKVVDNLGKGLKKNATYGDLLDYLHNKGYAVSLEPFFTFAFIDHTGYLLKIFKINVENGDAKWIFDEEKDYKGEGYGGSFWYQINYAIDIIINDIKEDNND